MSRGWPFTKSLQLWHGLLTCAGEGGAAGDVNILFGGPSVHHTTFDSLNFAKWTASFMVRAFCTQLRTKPTAIMPESGNTCKSN